MKKNLMSVLILALVFVNLVLTAITMISIVPSAKQSNALIAEICTALDLELQSGRTANLSSVKIENIKVYDLEDSLTINLTDSPDGSEHYAVVSVSVSEDSSNEDYATYGADLEGGGKDSLIKDTVRSVMTKYTYEEIKNDVSAPEAEVLEKLQGIWDSDFIIDVSLGATFQ